MLGTPGSACGFRHEAADTKAKIASPHNDVTGHQLHWVDAFGTCSMDFAGQMLGQLGAAVAAERGVMNSEATNAALAVVDGAAPKDEIEAMLLVQMVATQSVAMVMLNRAKFAETVPGMQEYGTLATKLLRTYTAQVEALVKLRRGGEQKVIVEHVHVYPGGQAVVGSVTTGTGGGGGGYLETLINPMRLPSKQLLLMRLSPRCGARTRLGTPCQGPATKGRRRCRLHGGAKGSGA